MRKILIFMLVFWLYASHLTAKELKIAVFLAPKQRPIYQKLLNQFTIETNIRGKLVVRNDATYKKQLPKWLLEGRDTPDVLYWQASQRLFYFVKKGAIQPISQLWKSENMDKTLSHVKSGVTYEGNIYAIPFSYYNWGLIYKKSLMKKYGPLPKDWEGFIGLCQKLKQDQIVPIVIGTKNNWPAAAWFDYINLRINGLAFHQQALMGSIPFTDARIKKVFIEWKRLIDARFFNPDCSSNAWDGVVPRLYRNRAGFMLIGNFVTSKLSKQIIDDIGFIPFPIINPSMPLFEEAPMDVFMIAKNTNMLKEAKAFLKFIARTDVQSDYNKLLGFLPTSKAGTVGDDYFIQAGANLLKNAHGVSQYFDRDTTPDFEAMAVPLLAQFILRGDIDWVTAQLEKARQEVFTD